MDFNKVILVIVVVLLVLNLYFTFSTQAQVNELKKMNDQIWVEASTRQVSMANGIVGINNELVFLKNEVKNKCGQ